MELIWLLATTKKTSLTPAYVLLLLPFVTVVFVRQPSMPFQLAETAKKQSWGNKRIVFCWVRKLNRLTERSHKFHNWLKGCGTVWVRSLFDCYGVTRFTQPNHKTLSQYSQWKMSYLKACHSGKSNQYKHKSLRNKLSGYRQLPSSVVFCSTQYDTRIRGIYRMKNNSRKSALI